MANSEIEILEKVQDRLCKLREDVGCLFASAEYDIYKIKHQIELDTDVMLKDQANRLEPKEIKQEVA